MRQFFLNIIQGVTLSMLVSVIVFCGLFAFLLGLPMSSTKDLKQFAKQMTDIRTAFKEGKAFTWGTPPELLAHDDFDIEAIEGKTAKGKSEDTPQDSASALHQIGKMISDESNSATEVNPEQYKLKLQLDRLQRQLDRIENESRGLRIQMTSLQKHFAGHKPATTNGVPTTK